MLFRKKCPSCGSNNPRGATSCASCGAPSEARQVEKPEALKDYDEAILLISINPQFAKAYSNRGYAYLGKGQYDMAIADCNKSIRLDPNDAVARLNRGAAYKLQGNEAEAIADFEKAVTLSDNPQLIKQAEQQIKELSR